MQRGCWGVVALEKGKELVWLGSDKRCAAVSLYPATTSYSVIPESGHCPCSFQREILFVPVFPDTKASPLSRLLY